jgi:hypothetical protein
MKKCFLYPLAFVFLIVGIYLIHLSPCPGGAIAREAIASTLDKSEVSTRIQKLSIPFILNQGQTDKRVKFYASTFGGTVFVTEKGEMIYSLQKTERDRKALKQKGNALKPDSKAVKGWVLKEELVGGRVKGVKTEEEAITKVSQFIGNDSSKWRSNIPTYGLVNLGEVYPGIEVKLRAYGRSVEKLFYVKAGVDPWNIRIKLSGGESLKVNGEGELEVKTSLGDVKFSKPVAYQELDGKRVEVAVNYHLLNSEPRTNPPTPPFEKGGQGGFDSELQTPNSQLVYSFNIGDYDRTKTLVIDPILQSTYLGGSGHETPYALALDSSGNVYLAGITTSTNFPGTTGGVQSSYRGGNYDIFVSKLNSALTSILQSTYLGGSGYEDWGYSIALDSSGNVYVVGGTSSTDFPGTTGGAQPSHGGDYDAFVSKLNSALTSILQSTYLGGSGHETPYALALDSSGNVYVAGITTSTNFPGTIGGAQPSHGGGSEDAFIAKLDSSLVASSIFSDVPPNYWAYDYIKAIYDAGITTGCAQDDPNTPQNERRYCPEDNVTRGQMAAFIIRAKYGENFSYTTTPYFTDVPSTHTFFKYVQKLKDDGITAVSGIYDVDSYVTRGQMAAFIIRAKFGENFTYTTTPYFSDVPSTHNFFKYVQKMKDEGITAVTGTYDVDSNVTRAQMAAFLARAFLGTGTATLEFPFSDPENVVRMAAWGIPNWSGTEPHNGIDLIISESLSSAKIISPTAGEVTSVTTSENPFSNPPGQLILTIDIRVNDEWVVDLVLEPGTTDPVLKSAQLAAVRVSPGQEVSVGTHVADLLVGTLGYPHLHYMVMKGDQNVCPYKYSSEVAKSIFDEIAATRPNNNLPDGNICYGQP